MSDEDDDLTISEVRALLGTTRRDARWHLTDELEILCLFARARFDLRQVETTGNEVVEVSVTCAFGSVDFIVPDGTMVVLDGTSFLASARSDVAAEGDSELPRIEITATTVLGRVKIVSPSHDEEEQAAEVIEIAAEPESAAAEPAPAAAEPVATAAATPVEPLAPSAPAPMPIPRPPANKYAVPAEEPDDDTPAPVVPQPPANKYAVPAEAPDDDEDGAAA